MFQPDPCSSDLISALCAKVHSAFNGITAPGTKLCILSRVLRGGAFGRVIAFIGGAILCGLAGLRILLLMDRDQPKNTSYQQQQRKNYTFSYA
jgi:hypothetical protein